MEAPLGKSTIASTAGIGAPLLALGWWSSSSVVTSSVTGSAFFFESFCGVILTAMLWVLPSGPLSDGARTAPANSGGGDGHSHRDGDELVRRLRMGIRSYFEFWRSASTSLTAPQAQSSALNSS